MKKKFRDINKPTMIGDLDDLAAQIIGAVVKETTRIEEKIDGISNKLFGKIEAIDSKVTTLGKKVDSLDYKVSDIHRRVIDLEVDTVPRKDFQDLKFLVATQGHK